MRTIFKISVFCFFIGLLTACYKDLGNYNLVDNNQIIITTVAALTKTTVPVGDTVIIVPKITWRYPERDTTSAAFSFEWQLVNATTSDVISNERDLKWKSDKVGSFTAVLLVTEKATGVETRLTTTVSVTSLYSEGFLFLSEKDGKPILSFLGRITTKSVRPKEYEYRSYVDIYPAGNDPLPASARLVTSYIVGSEASEIMLIDDDGCWILDGNSLEKTSTLRNVFMGGGYPSGFQPQYFYRGGAANWALAADGNLYLGLLNAFPPTDWLHDPIMQTPIYVSGGAKFRYLESSVAFYDYLVLFDELNNRLCFFNSSWSSVGWNEGQALTIVSSSTPPIANIAHFDNFKFLSFNWSGSKYSPVYSLFLKDQNDGKYYYYEFSISFDYQHTITVTGIQQREFEGSAYITDNTLFWRLDNNPYVYFAEGSKLYFYDLNTRAVKLYKDFGNGVKITQLRQALKDINAPNIAVVLSTGDFYLYDATSAAVLSAPDPSAEGLIYHFSGLGTVKNVAWKYKSSFSYSEQIWSDY